MAGVGSERAKSVKFGRKPWVFAWKNWIWPERWEFRVGKPHDIFNIKNHLEEFRGSWKNVLNKAKLGVHQELAGTGTTGTWSGKWCLPHWLDKTVSRSDRDCTLDVLYVELNIKSTILCI